MDISDVRVHGDALLSRRFTALHAGPDGRLMSCLIDLDDHSPYWDVTVSGCALRDATYCEC